MRSTNEMASSPAVWRSRYTSPGSRVTTMVAAGARREVTVRSRPGPTPSLAPEPEAAPAAGPPMGTWRRPGPPSSQDQGLGQYEVPGGGPGISTETRAGEG